ncbi:transposon Tf2-12 polyprotein [Elysia marginata]|uniref:Transposon Tf2-12 polyprotein n=1 Tax=Elysia marginata TaxID=1093978 RepID=A0AAV4GTM8_9GAST|nr:transposon Tf2-12 polyprotein [Elysia marginata]
MMNFGATLTLAVKKLLCGMDNVVDYIDDLLVHTETWEAHVETLAELFRRLREANFTIRPIQCVLGSPTVDFIGHRLGQGTMKMLRRLGMLRGPRRRKRLKLSWGLSATTKSLCLISLRSLPLFRT